MKPNICYINSHDGITGAGIGGYRTFKGINDFCDEINIEMLVRYKSTKNPKVKKIKKIFWWWLVYLQFKMQCRIQKSIFNSFRTNNKSKHSLCNLNYISQKYLNNSKYDIITLHWLGDLILSIEEIGKIKKPVVWKLADQWPFSGAEHYTCSIDFNGKTNISERYKFGYFDNNRPLYEIGKDINKLTWERKYKSWKKPIHIICPSKWLANCAKESILMKDWPIYVIPNSIDTNIWYPQEKKYSRKELSLPSENPIIFFNSSLGMKDKRKGGDLLLKSLEILKATTINPYLKKIELIILGQKSLIKNHNFKVPIHYYMPTNNIKLIRLLYTASDVIAIPSRQDNLPNVGQEAFACGRPVLAFNYSGLIDIVDHQVNGCLAKPFDPYSLAKSIEWLFENNERLDLLGNNALIKAKSEWDPHLISKRYQDIYLDIFKIGSTQIS